MPKRVLGGSRRRGRPVTWMRGIAEAIRQKQLVGEEWVDRGHILKLTLGPVVITYHPHITVLYRLLFQVATACPR